MGANLQQWQDWDWNLSHHTPTVEGIKKILAFREKAKEFAETVIEQAGECRERDLALMHLEQSLYYANQAIARYETDDQRPV